MDIQQAYPLIKGISPQVVIAGKAYSVHAFRAQIQKSNIHSLISAIHRGNRSLIKYDKHLYKVRHIIENAFMKPNQRQPVATRHAKRGSSFRQQCMCVALPYSVKSCDDSP